jgi:TetR/AcrR family transcriptional regulator, regulator of cefoperazone and chloramphenicol sensitivity
MSASEVTSPGGDTKDRLMEAGEMLFARDGIEGTTIRELNELAGQRNSSALHYHFGTRAGLATAILLRHQGEIDVEIHAGLDRVVADGVASDVRAVIATAVRPMAHRIETPRGRNWARIVPQILPRMSDNLRRGVVRPITPETHRLLQMVGATLRHLPERVRNERLVTYSLFVTTLLAERAHQMEARTAPSLDTDQFVAHTLDILTAGISAPSTVHLDAPTAAHR